MATLSQPRIKVAARSDFFVKLLLHFTKFLVYAKLDLVRKCI